MSDLYTPDLIGRKVLMPDGGEATIAAISVQGQFRRIEWFLLWWYQGDRRERWVEPWEVKLIEETAR